MGYHYIRVHLADKVRPGKIERIEASENGEPLWQIEMVTRDDASKRGDLSIGVNTGSIHSWKAVKTLTAEAG